MLITRQKLNTLLDRVQYCLEHYPESRDSDIELFARLCERFYPPFERPLYNWRDLAGAMHSVPSMDHVARARRKIIQENDYQKYLPNTVGIAEHRGINEKIWYAFARSTNILPLQRTNLKPGFDDE